MTTGSSAQEQELNPSQEPMIPPWKNILQDRKVPRVKNVQPTTNPEIQTSKNQQQYRQPEQSPKRRKKVKECLVDNEHRDSHPDRQSRRLDKPVKRLSLHLTPQDPVREINRAHVQDRAPNRPRRRRQQRGKKPHEQEINPSRDPCDQ